MTTRRKSKPKFIDRFQKSKVGLPQGNNINNIPPRR